MSSSAKTLSPLRDALATCLQVLPILPAIPKESLQPLSIVSIHPNLSPERRLVPTGATLTEIVGEDDDDAQALKNCKVDGGLREEREFSFCSEHGAFAGVAVPSIATAHGSVDDERMTDIKIINERTIKVRNVCGTIRKLLRKKDIVLSLLDKTHLTSSAEFRAGGQALIGIVLSTVCCDRMVALGKKGQSANIIGSVGEEMGTGGAGFQVKKEVEINDGGVIGASLLVFGMHKTGTDTLLISQPLHLVNDETVDDLRKDRLIKVTRKRRLSLRRRAVTGGAFYEGVLAEINGPELTDMLAVPSDSAGQSAEKIFGLQAKDVCRYLLEMQKNESGAEADDALLIVPGFEMLGNEDFIAKLDWKEIQAE